jgi:hypothetical protein
MIPIKEIHHSNVNPGKLILEKSKSRNPINATKKTQTIHRIV